MSSDTDDIQAMTEARRLYSDTVIDHARHPRNLGELRNADGIAKVTGPCGDTMEVWLNVKNNTITEISFLTDGCGTSIASGSMMTELVKGKAVEKAAGINQQDILHALGGLPEESRHCALLAAQTLKAAIRDHLAMRREPWKKAYRQH